MDALMEIKDIITSKLDINNLKYFASFEGQAGIFVSGVPIAFEP